MILEYHFGSNDRFDPSGLGGLLKAHDPGDRHPIGDGQGGLTKLECSPYQGFWARGSTLKTEPGSGMQVNEVVQSNHPATNQPGSIP
jgi:hypothetical protein